MALSHSPQIVRDGLVLYLDAANIKSYPGTGTTWFDLSNIKNNGTINNNPTYLNNNKGIFSFDGTNENITIGETSSLNLQSYTYCFWIKRIEPANTGWLQFMQRSTSGRNPGIWFYINEANRIHFSIYMSGAFNTSVDPSGFFLNEWHYFTATVDYSNNTTILKGYTDGILKQTTTHADNYPVLGTGISYIGNRLFDLGIFSVYNRALSNDEIKENFNATRGRYGI
jgi:hypothetical protein